MTITLQAVNELIQSLESAGDLTIMMFRSEGADK